MKQPAATEAEYHALAAIGGAVLGTSVTPEQIAAAGPLLERLRTSDRVQLRAAIHLVNRIAPLLAGRLCAMTELSPEEREHILARWAASRLPLRRQVVAALKTVAAAAHYGEQSGWRSVGYDGPWLGRVQVPVLPVPVVPQSSSRAPGIISGRALTSDVRLRTQACVIGTGAGGAAALARLSELDIDAVAVEAGGYSRARHYNQRVLDMLPLLYREAGLRATRDKAIGILQGTGVGGSTLHNTGLVYETPSGILERWRQEHGFDCLDAELQPLLRRVFQVLGAVPIAESQINANNAALRRGADSLGWRYRIAHHNRVECSGCGYCMLGCAYNRKNNAALTWIPRAVAGGARILTDASATRIEGVTGRRRVICGLLDADGRATGARAVIECNIVLVAAGALDTPALLQRSGLGNRHVGRRLRLHPAAPVGAVFPQPVESWRGLPQSVVLEEFASFMHSGRGGFLVIPGAANWPALAAAVLSAFGAEHRALMVDLPRTATAAVLLHDETAGHVKADRWGRPVADYWPNNADHRELRRGVAALARLYLAAGAQRVVLPYAGLRPVSSEAELERELARARPEPHRVSLNSVHPQGTCGLGSDPRRSACRPDGELWKVPGVFVCDTSLFPTSVGVPPQVTTMALGQMVAERAAQQA